MLVLARPPSGVPVSCLPERVHRPGGFGILLFDLFIICVLLSAMLSSVSVLLLLSNLLSYLAIIVIARGHKNRIE